MINNRNYPSIQAFALFASLLTTGVNLHAQTNAVVLQEPRKQPVSIAGQSNDTIKVKPVGQDQSIYWPEDFKFESEDGKWRNQFRMLRLLGEDFIVTEDTVFTAKTVAKPKGR